MDRSLIKNTIIERLFFNEIINVEDYWPLFELSLRQENIGGLKNKDKPIDATLNQRNLCLEKLKNEKEGIFLFLILALNGAPHQRDSFNYNFNEYEILSDEKYSITFTKKTIIPSFKNNKECYEIIFDYETSLSRLYNTSFYKRKNITPAIIKYNKWWTGKGGRGIKVSIIKKDDDNNELIFETDLIDMRYFFSSSDSIKKLNDDEFLKIIKLYKILRKVSDDIKESIFVKLYEYQALSDSLLNSIRIKEQEISEAQEFEKEYNLDKEFDAKYEI